MPTSTRSISRQATADLRHLVHARGALGLLLALSTGVVLTFSGGLSHARASQAFFEQEVQEYAARGESLTDALAAPVGVTPVTGGETITNPLKYDFIELSKAISALGWPHFPSAALDLMTFFVLPLMFVVLGAHLATKDLRAGTTRVRASRERWSRVTAASLATLLVVAIVSVVVTIVLAIVVALVGSSQADAVASSVDYGLMTPEPVAPLWLKAAFSAGVAVFFGVWGHALGFLTRSLVWPGVASVLFLFVVPFLAPADPRNALAQLSQGIFDYWGQFKMRTPLPMTDAAAAGCLLAYLALGLAVVAISARVIRIRA